MEQEKREQEKRQHVDSSGVNNNVSSTGSSLPALMSDADFELLRADVMNSSSTGNAIASPPIIQQSNTFNFNLLLLLFIFKMLLTVKMCIGGTGVVQQVGDQMHMQRPTFIQRPTSQPIQNWTQPQQLSNPSTVRQQFTDQCW